MITAPLPLKKIGLMLISLLQALCAPVAQQCATVGTAVVLSVISSPDVGGAVHLFAVLLVINGPLRKPVLPHSAARISCSAQAC